MSVFRTLVPLMVITAIFAVGLSFLAVHRFDVAVTTRLLRSFEFALILALWVRADKQVRGYNAPFEFEAFVFFGWPVVVPYYLYRTRGWRGLALGAGIWFVRKPVRDSRDCQRLAGPISGWRGQERVKSRALFTNHSFFSSCRS